MSSVSVTPQAALSIELIRRHLSSETFASHIYLFDTVSSTNDTLCRLAVGAQDGTVVLAETQTAGRGRGGKAWFSPPGVNLYLSVLLRPAMPVRTVPIFSFITSLALTEAVAVEHVEADIKWPNDIVVGGRKLAGTLVQSSARGDRLVHVILGMGVNVNVTAAALRKGLGGEAEAATSIREVVGRETDRNKFAATVLNCLEKWLEVWCRQGPEAVLQAWRHSDVLAGHRLVIRNGQAEHACRALGVDQEGRLVVESREGAVHHVVGGEIRVTD